MTVVARRGPDPDRSVSLSALPGVSQIRPSHYIQDLPASRLASDGGVDQSGRTQDFKVDDLEPLTGSVPVTAAVNPQTGGTLPIYLCL